ncbi:MAG: ribosome biogenesis factor YjgA [Pseudomonadota bacterium]|nr:ribosome biogenesis factor YjgA [Pseudomonadota bacterium]
MTADFRKGDDGSLIESKSARKRKMLALQNLGEQLVDLSAAQLQRLNIDNKPLIEAVQLAQRISHHSGKRRQMQFIGKLMRSADTEQISNALAALQETSRKAKAQERIVEGARDALLARGDDALPEVLAIWPQADGQLIGQLTRSAQEERQRDQAPTSSRKLFRYLRSLSKASTED